MEGRHQIFFVCASIINNELIMESIPADSLESANVLFKDKYNLFPKSTLGPFAKRRPAKVEPIKLIKFNGKQQKAVYNDWIVNALFLSEPEGKAFLLFLKRVDSEKKTPPKGTIIVPTNDLRLL